MGQSLKFPVMLMSNNTIIIYCDGACKGNPGIGGWGAVIESNGFCRELWGYLPATTNQVMELTAAIKPISTLKTGQVIEVFSDSQYLVKGMTEWLLNWKRRNWKTASGEPVKNKALWVELDKLHQSHSITWSWVRGHNGDIGNEKADKLANRGIVERVEFASVIL